MNHDLTCCHSLFPIWSLDSTKLTANLSHLLLLNPHFPNGHLFNYSKLTKIILIIIDKKRFRDLDERFWSASLTFLGRPQQNHEAVVSLQLIEVRPDLHLVLGVAVQIWQDDAVVGRGLHVLHQPGAADGSVEYAEALNEARLEGDLRKNIREEPK